MRISQRGTEQVENDRCQCRMFSGTQYKLSSDEELFDDIKPVVRQKEKGHLGPDEGEGKNRLPKEGIPVRGRYRFPRIVHETDLHRGY